MRILLAYDGSECADASLNSLKRAGLPDYASINVLSVAEHWLPPPAMVELLDGVDRRLEVIELNNNAIRRLQSINNMWETQGDVVFGSPATEILKRADEMKPDLIVLGSHGRTGLGQFLLGSVSQTILHHASSSVRIGRSGFSRNDGPGRLVIGIDGSKYSASAVDVVAGRNWPDDTEVYLVNARWPTPRLTDDSMLPQISAWLKEENLRVQKEIDSAIAKLKSVGLKTHIVIREGEPKQLLCKQAETIKADCIFMGARGLSAIERFLTGSVTSGVAARAECSVEVVIQSSKR